MKLFKILVTLLTGGTLCHAASLEPARHVVVMVWDAMRPDFVTKEYAPTLFELAQHGVTFRNHHSAYLSSTEVNGTAISTGDWPSHDGIIGNKEYRPQIDPLKSVHMEELVVVRKGDAGSRAAYVHAPTIAEIVRKAGGRTAIAGAKGVVLLADREDRTKADRGAVVYAGATLPAGLGKTLTNRLGSFPSEITSGRTRNDWTTSALIDTLWANGVPEFTFLWMHEPDASQHKTGPGSKQSIAAIKNVDQNLARVLKALEEKGVRGSTDVLVVSDHGCSTVYAQVDLEKELRNAGLRTTRQFKQPPSDGQIMVVSNSGSVFVYVIGHDDALIEKVARFLEGWQFSGVIFTRNGIPGTFPLSQIHLDSEDAPDLVVSLRWNGDKSKVGVPGFVASDSSSYGVSQGTHVTLSPYDMHATLIAAGPDFREGFEDTTATGNVDVAPTVLQVLGIKPPQPMDGRVLAEALKGEPSDPVTSHSRRVEVTNTVGKIVWKQYLALTEVNWVTYCDEGNGEQIAK